MVKPLQQAMLTIPLSGGLSEKVDPRLLPLGSLSRVENGVWSKTGSIRKRQGYNRLTMLDLPGNSLAGVQQFVPYGDSMLALTNDRAYEFSPQTQRWIPKGFFPCRTANEQAVAATGTSFTGASMVVGTKYFVHAWADTSFNAPGIFVAFTDQTTGTLVKPPIKLSSDLANAVRIVNIGDTVGVFWRSYGPPGQLFGAVLDANAVTVTTAATTLFADDHGAGFDVLAMHGSITNSFLYAHKDGSGNVEFIRYTVALVVNASASKTPTGDPQSITLLAGLTGQVTETAYCAWSPANTGIEFVSVDPSALTFGTVTAVTGAGVGPVGMARISANDWGITWYDSFQPTEIPPLTSSVDPGSNLSAVKAARVSSGTPSSPRTLGVNFYFVSRPWYDSVKNEIFAITSVGATVSTTSVSTIFVTRLGSFSYQLAALGFNTGTDLAYPVTTLRAVTAGSPEIGIIDVTPVLSSNPSINRTPMIDGQSNLLSFNGNLYWTGAYQNGGTQFALARWEMPRTTFSPASPLGDETYFGSGVPSRYDGEKLLENAFSPIPVVAKVQLNVGASAMAAGTYWYKAVYTWIDAQGRLMRSVDSQPVSQTLSTSNDHFLKVTVSFMSLSTVIQSAVGGNVPPVQVELYRSTDGVVFQLLYILSGTYSQSTDNDPTTKNFTYSDKGGFDPVVKGSRAIYTQGGILANDATASADGCVVNKDRVWLSRERFLDYSQVFDGSTVPGFSPVLESDVWSGEDIITIASLDEKIIVFKSSRIFVLFGEGPSATGAGNDIRAAQPLPTDVGCIEAASVAEIPAGLLFQSASGIYLLGRDLSLQPVGTAVETTLSTYPVIKSVAVVPEQRQVRWVCQDTLGSIGIVLVYDYLNSNWSTHSYSGEIPCACATDSSGTFWWTDGTTQFTERTVAENFKDSNIFISTTFETPWVQTSGLLGFQKLMRLGFLFERFDPANLLIEVAYDFSPLYLDQDKYYLDYPTLEGLMIDRVLIRPRRQHCTSFRLRVSDAVATGATSTVTGQGFGFTGIVVEYGSRATYARTTPGQRT